MIMKKILVPIDFSANAVKAFRYALEIATKNKGEIILYHLYTPMKRSITELAKSRKLHNVQTEINSLKKLNRLKKKVLADSEVAVSTVIGRTPIINNILGYAQNNNIDIIIMGTKGATGLKKVFIGSVASKIANKTDKPVLLVPEKYKLKVPERINFATDYQQLDKKALELTLAISKLFNGKVTIFYLMSAYNMEAEKQKKAFENYADLLKQKFNKYKLGFQIIETISIGEAMENLDKKIPFDLLVMVRHNKNFYQRTIGGSFTQMMARSTKKPLLIVPEGKTEIEGFETKIKEIKTLDPGKLQIKKIKRKVSS